MAAKSTRVCETSALGVVEQSSTPGQHRFKVRVIEGDRWGSSGYYPATVLRQDGPKVFTEGTQMYLNHPSWTDEFDQPERRVQDIIGVLSSDAVYDEASKSLTAEATVFSHYAAMINEIAPHIGVSIRAYATAEEGEMDGQWGDIITGFIKAESVDVVTKAGAGGAILSVIESAFPKRNTVVASAQASTESSNTGSPTKEAAMAEITAEQATALTNGMKALTDALVAEAAARQAAKEEAEKPTPVDTLAVARALAESGIPAVMHVDVTNAIESGTPVAEAVKAVKDRYDMIVAEAKGQPKPVVIGTPQPASAGVLSESDTKRLHAYLLGSHAAQ